MGRAAPSTASATLTSRSHQQPLVNQQQQGSCWVCSTKHLSPSRSHQQVVGQQQDARPASPQALQHISWLHCGRGSLLTGVLDILGRGDVPFSFPAPCVVPPTSFWPLQVSPHKSQTLVMSLMVASAPEIARAMLLAADVVLALQPNAAHAGQAQERDPGNTDVHVSQRGGRRGRGWSRPSLLEILCCLFCVHAYKSNQGRTRQGKGCSVACAGGARELGTEDLHPM